MRPDARFWPGWGLWDFDDLRGSCPSSGPAHTRGAEACADCSAAAWHRYYRATALQFRAELETHLDQAQHALERAVRRERPWRAVDTEAKIPGAWLEDWHAIKQRVAIVAPRARCAVRRQAR